MIALTFIGDLLWTVVRIIVYALLFAALMLITSVQLLTVALKLLRARLSKPTDK